MSTNITLQRLKGTHLEVTRLLSLHIFGQLCFRHKKVITTTIRLMIGIGLAYFLIHYTLRSTHTNLWGEVLQASKLLLLLSLFLYGAVLGLTVYRWKILLGVQDLNLRTWELIRLTMIGAFFNLALPGAVSGDLVKMAFVARQTKDKKAEAVLTVIFDRALGLFGLFIVASVMVLFCLPFLLDLGAEYYPIRVASFVVALGSIGGVCGIAMMELRQNLLRYRWIVRVVDFGTRSLPASLVLTLRRLGFALERYRTNRGTIAVAIALSVLIHSLFAVNLFLVGASVGENVLRLHHYFLVTPVSNAVAAIPLTPAGIGTRDATIAMFLKASGAPMETTGVVPIIMTLIILFWGVVGGVFFVFSGASRAANPDARASS